MNTAIDRFLAHLVRERGRAENTVLAYRADLQQMQQVVDTQVGAGPPTLNITADALTDYVDWLADQGYRPATVSRKMAAVRTFLDYLRNVEGRSGAWLKSELKPPPAPKYQPRVLTRDEIRELLEAPEKLGTARGMRDAAILSLLYATGLRAAEAVSLNVASIDMPSRLLKKPGGAGETLPLNVAERPVRRYLSEGRTNLLRDPDETALFLNQRGQRLSRQGLWLVVKRWAKTLGLGDEISPHTLRHTLANHLLSDGVSRKEVQRVLGLSSPNTIRVHHDHLSY